MGVGHFNAAHLVMTEARAVRLIVDVADARGHEDIIPRKVERRGIHAVREVTQVVGWRYYPTRTENGSAVVRCVLLAGPRGSIRSRKLRGAYDAAMNS